MGKEKLAIAFSQNYDTDSAIKMISRNIKSSLGTQPISLALLFFTPRYQPMFIKETLSITLKSENIFAIQSPLLIFQNKIIKRGIVCCCLTKNNISVKSSFIKKTDVTDVEFLFKKNIISLKEKQRFLISSLGPQINVYNYLRGLSLAVGRNFNVFGAGFLKKYGIKNFLVVNNTIEEGLGSIILGGKFNIDNIKVGGFIPLGKKFTITKVALEKNRIIEIDKKPAGLIYKKYLGDKFDLFKKTSMCSFYPIGIKNNGNYNLIHIIDILRDDSLFCIGNIKEKTEAHIMIATQETLLKEVKNAVRYIKNDFDYDVAIIFNSLARRKILKNNADKEIQNLKGILGEKTKVIGLYCDYQIFPSDYIKEFTIGNYFLSMILLKYGDY